MLAFPTPVSSRGPPAVSADQNKPTIAQNFPPLLTFSFRFARAPQRTAATTIFRQFPHDQNEPTESSRLFTEPLAHQNAQNEPTEIPANSSSTHFPSITNSQSTITHAPSKRTQRTHHSATRDFFHSPLKSCDVLQPPATFSSQQYPSSPTSPSAYHPPLCQSHTASSSPPSSPFCSHFPLAPIFPKQTVSSCSMAWSSTPSVSPTTSCTSKPSRTAASPASPGQAPAPPETFSSARLPLVPLDSKGRRIHPHFRRTALRPILRRAAIPRRTRPQLRKKPRHRQAVVRGMSKKLPEHHPLYQPVRRPPHRRQHGPLPPDLPPRHALLRHLPHLARSGQLALLFWRSPALPCFLHEQQHPLRLLDADLPRRKQIPRPQRIRTPPRHLRRLDLRRQNADLFHLQRRLQFPLPENYNGSGDTTLKPAYAWLKQILHEKTHSLPISANSAASTRVGFWRRRNYPWGVAAWKFNKDLPQLRGITVTNTSKLHDSAPADVAVGLFHPLDETDTARSDHATNALAAPTATADSATQKITLNLVLKPGTKIQKVNASPANSKRQRSNKSAKPTAICSTSISPAGTGDLPLHHHRIRLGITTRTPRNATRCFLPNDFPLYFSAARIYSIH